MISFPRFCNDARGSSRRWSTVAGNSRSHPSSARSEPGGRLLVYFPDADLADGAAEAESAGFFDVHNTPPWDTWVALFDDPLQGPDYGAFVLAWVPQPFVELADRGIRVNPEECILWLEDAPVSNKAELLALRPAWR